MTLHVEVFGTGEPLLLLHGWGMHGGLWGDLPQRLSTRFAVHCVDLPGHGYSAAQPLCPAENESVLDSLVSRLQAQFDAPMHLCGWSLGGQIAARWALRAPQQIRSVALLSSTPCFVQRDDWPCAMPADLLAQFASALQQDYAATLRRFLALQVRGSEQERELLQRLRQALFSRGQPDAVSLQHGLTVLRDSNFRGQSWAQPTCFIAGERDTLTPAAAAERWAASLPQADFSRVAGAAHAPFLSHPDVVVRRLMDFWHE